MPSRSLFAALGAATTGFSYWLYGMVIYKLALPKADSRIDIVGRERESYRWKLGEVGRGF